MFSRKAQQKSTRFRWFRSLYPSHINISIIRVCAAFLLLVMVASSPAARFVLLLSSILIEIGFRFLFYRSAKSQILYHGIFSFFILLLQYIIVLYINNYTNTKSEFWFSGVRIPAKGKKSVL